MAQTPVENISEDLKNVLVASGVVETERKSYSAYSSVENSPLFDRESNLRYSASSKDEFWDAALSSNYDYLMDDGLIATCREASSDLSLDDESEISEAPSFTRFIEQFKWLHDLLHNLQIAKDDDSPEKSSRIYEEQQKVAYCCKVFNEQAQKLCKRYPDMKDEVQRRLNLLNNKWKAVEQSINPNNAKSPSKDGMFDEITSHMRKLRKWLRDLESRLYPVSSASSWSREVLEEKYKLQIALQKEIEGKGHYVSSLLKLCGQLKGNVPFGQNALMIWDAERVRKVANNLQHRWHSIWIKSLECQMVLEQSLGNSKDVCEKLEKSFSEEPLKKYPRLGDNCETITQIENELKGKMNLPLSPDLPKNSFALQKCDVTVKNDKAVMVGATGIAELKADCAGGTGKFEIVQDVGYSSETSAHLSTDEKVEIVDFQENGIPSSLPKSTLCSDRISQNKPYLAPDKYPSMSLKTLHILSEDRSSYNSKHGSCKGVPDLFYKVACIDDDIFDDVSKPQDNLESTQFVTGAPTEDSCQAFLKFAEEVSSSSPKIHKSLEKCKPKQLFKPSEKEVPLSRQAHLLSDSAPALKKQVHLHPDSVHTMAKKSRRNSKDPSSSGPKVINSKDLWRKSARVCEWLKTCHSGDDITSDDNVNGKEKVTKGNWSQKVVNSSCDASGECTTTESDSEKSNTSDVNNSVTLSQSFTGSIETVIPAAQEDVTVASGDRAANLESSTGVRMRKKKRTTRDRPWSVIELNRTLLPSGTVPHSTSEGALNLLYCSQDSAKMSSRKLCPKNKRLSLTDISNLSSPPVRGQLWKQKSLNDPNSHPSSSLERLVVSKKTGSVSDQNSDNCETLVVTALKAAPVEVSRCIDTFGDVQVVLSETNSLPETSLDTDVAGGIGSAEDQYSISDQAWDEYQDPPYLSEPYSELTVDEDEVRRLTSFGDDYRATLGSYSDASSVNLRLPFPKHRTRTRSTVAKSDEPLSSDSDSEDFHHILEASTKNFQFVNNSIRESTNKTSSLSSEFAELVATCRTNLCHLNAIAAAGCELESVSAEDVLRLKDLIKAWEDLETRILVLSRSSKEPKPSSIDVEAATEDVHFSLTTLKERLGNMAEHARDAFDGALSLEQVAANIQNLQTGLTNLQELKDSVLAVSARILRLAAEGGSSLAPLKESATKLYQQWEDVYELNCSQLTKLQDLQSHWAESTEDQLDEQLETTLQWQPVQVGSSLPKAQVSREALHTTAAAVVQVADLHDTVFDIESKPSTFQCLLVEDSNEELQEPLLRWSLPVQRLSVSDEDTPDWKPRPEISCSTRNRSYLWRALRAMVPIQFAMVILYCLSCYFEPQCCENINNYDYSILPKLRFPGGPPPV